jgi:catechol-2,3-dioxygenase
MRIDELTLDASDLAPLYEFYAGDLGLPVVRRSPDLLALRVGATQLQFRRAAGKPFYHFAFNVHPSRFERARATLAALTPLLHDSDGEEIFDFRSWNARASYFYDPLGNIVELIARRDLSHMPVPPDPGWMSASEIGLVTDDVPALTARIGREIGLPVYRESAGESFAALGDAEGLLILVQRGRVWYPETGKAAVNAALSMELQHGDARWQVKGPPYQFARLVTPAA